VSFAAPADSRDWRIARRDRNETPDRRAADDESGPCPKALQQQKPANCKADDLVLVNGVPKMKEFRQDLKKGGHTVSGRTRTSYGLSRTADNFHHAALNHESASPAGDGTGTPQRYAPDNQNLHGCRAVAVARSDGYVAVIWW